MNATDEQRRIRYLQAMDIPVYVSRVDCAGALPTTRVPVPRSAVLTDTGPVAVPAGTSTPGDTDPASGLTHMPARALEPKREIPPHAAAATESTSTESTNTSKPSTVSTNAAVRFSLVLFKAGRWLWLEETPDGTLASDQVKLVAAMAAALTNAGAGAKVKPATWQFKWPPHNNAQFDLGAEAAQMGLEAFLQRHVDDSGCSGLIVLGEAARLRLGEVTLSVPISASMLGTRDMILQPNLKKQVWSDIKPLAGIS